MKENTCLTPETTEGIMAPGHSRGDSGQNLNTSRYGMKNLDGCYQNQLGEAITPQKHPIYDPTKGVRPAEHLRGCYDAQCRHHGLEAGSPLQTKEGGVYE